MEEVFQKLNGMKKHIDYMQLIKIFKPKEELIIFVQRTWRRITAEPPRRLMTMRIKLLIFTAKLCQITRKYMPLEKVWGRLEKTKYKLKNMQVRKIKNENK